MEKTILIVTEKPDAAQKIAIALDVNNKPVKVYDNGVFYYIAQKNKKLIVVPALGHLYTVAGVSGKRNFYPVFQFNWIPRYLAERRANKTRFRVETIAKLAKEADTYINACDYDIEGSLIGYCILKFACGNKEAIAKRMRYSTLTQQELEKAYNEACSHLDFDLVDAGLTRHELDWLYGVNFSRALTSALNNWSGTQTTLSTGRVQGPTLKFLVVREKEIGFFVPIPFWKMKIKVNLSNSIFQVDYEKTINSEKEAHTIEKVCKEKDGEIEKIDNIQHQKNPPVPFNLGALQSDAYNLFGYPPILTLNIAQQLYLKASISYPRTNSQKLPSAINYRGILESLSKIRKYKTHTENLLTLTKLYPREGKKEDSAHPAIYPTGHYSKNMSTAERKVWDLIVRRFLSVFAKPAIIHEMLVCINIAGYRFYSRKRRTLEKGWLKIYEPLLRLKESVFPAIKKGQKITQKKVILEKLFTKPKPRYNQSSLLTKMEKTEIGTKATRASIIQKLYHRGYIHGQQIVVTDLGFAIFEVLEKYCPTIISEKLTKDLETRMAQIQLKSEKREQVLLDAIDTLKPVLKNVKENEKVIGKQLSKALRRVQYTERSIVTCPLCKTGKLIIVRSRKTGKRFVGCSNYFKRTCTASFPTPQKGTLRLLTKKCRICGWVTLKNRRVGGGTWIFCLNPSCPSKMEREKA